MESGDWSLMPARVLIKDEPKCLIWSERLEDGTPAVLKMYRHRGAAGFLRESLFGFRAAREYAALSCLERLGIPCSRPLFWKWGYDRAHGFHETLATREIEGAVALNAAWTAPETAKLEIDGEALFEAVARMHKGGVFHGALSPKNILVIPGGSLPAAFHLVDTARSKLFPASIFGRRIAAYDLLQLVVKLERFLGQGACKPYLHRYGLDADSIERLYAEAANYGTLRRRDKLIQARLTANIQWAAWSARRLG
jgi:hypothetical protein